MNVGFDSGDDEGEGYLADTDTAACEARHLKTGYSSVVDKLLTRTGLFLEDINEIVGMEKFPKANVMLIDVFTACIGFATSFTSVFRCHTQPMRATLLPEVR